MPTKFAPQQQSVNTQSATRRFMTFWDQHKVMAWPTGRPWGGWAERPADPMNAGMPHVISVNPGGYSLEGQNLMARGGAPLPQHLLSWTAPFIPDAKYLDFTRVPFGQLELRYDRMKADDLKATEEYYELAAGISLDRNLPIAEPGRPVHFAVQHVIGRAPRDPRIADALMAGDPWILGVANGSKDWTADNHENPELRRLVENLGKRTSYVQQAMERAPQTVTMTMTPEQIAILVANEVAKALAGRAPAPGTEPPVPIEAVKTVSGVAEWQEFCARHKGQGISLTQLSVMYKAEQAQKLAEVGA